MVLKINNLKYKRYKKVIFSDLNFSVNNQEVLGIYFENKFLQLFFLKLLLGNKKPYSGNIYLNNNNITILLPKERKIGCVYPAGLLRLSFLSIKLRLVYCMLKAPNFLCNSSLKYIKTKFFYKNLFFINNDLNKQNLMFKTDKIINEFYNSIDIKKEWIKTYLNKINELYKKEISKVLNYNKNSILVQSLYTYNYKREEIRVYEGYLAFLQALWDKIYYISDLDYLCDCYEISKKRKLKNKNFGFIGAKLVCEKYLKILQIEIAHERYLLIKARKALKKYWFNVLIVNLNNDKHNNVIKVILNKDNFANIIIWAKLSEDEWFEYNEKQEQLITNLLPDEATIIKGKVYEYFHKYHLDLLNNTLKTKEKNNSIIIEGANTKVVTIYNQAFEDIKKLINKLNIKINLFKFTKNLSSFDYIKIRLINTILNNKELIILYNIFDNLTISEVNELNEILLSLKNYNSQLIFLVLTKSINKIKNYVTQLLFFDKDNNYKLISKNNDEFLPYTIDLYKILYKNSENIFTVKYFSAENILKNENIEIKLPKETKLINKKECYNLAVNPNLISFKKTKEFNKDIYLIYKGYVKSIKKVAKLIICFFEVSDDFIFKILITEKELNFKKITSIYFKKNALLVYDKDDNNLVVNI